LTQGLENNEKSHKNLEINDLNEQIWVKRLDMVFDLSNFKGLKLNEKEISEYVNILNYGYGDPNKIHDIYELELTSNKGKVYNYEFTGTDMVRFYHQGSIIDKNGDIIAINVQKVMDALNKYYS